jgi:hypothetical protein
MYEKQARKGNDTHVQASEIPDLRRFCQSITAEVRHREALHFLQSSVSSLLHSLGLWLNSHAPVLRDNERGIDESSRRRILQALQDADTAV